MNTHASHNVGVMVSKVPSVEERRTRVHLVVTILITLLVIWALVSLGNLSELANLGEVAYEKRANLAVFLGLAAAISLLCRLLVALFVDIAPYRQVLGQLQEVTYLRDYKRLAKGAITMLGILGLWGGFIYKGLEIPTYKAELSGALVVATIIAFNSFKDYALFFLRGFRLFRKKESFSLVGLSPLMASEIIYPEYRPSAWSQVMLVNDDVNIRLAELDGSKSDAVNRDLKIDVAKVRHKLSEAASDKRSAVLFLKRATGSRLWNERKVRLCSDPESFLYSGADSVIVQETDYYDSLCSNEAVNLGVLERGSGRREDIWRDMMLAPGGNYLYELSHGENALSNHIGISVLAISDSGRIFVQSQGRGAHITPGKAVPTGSGSADWRDLKKFSGGFLAFIKHSMLREMYEEAGIEQSHVKAMSLIGFSRDVSRGGLPDFYAVAIVSAKAVRPRGDESSLIDAFYQRKELPMHLGLAAFRDDLAEYAKAIRPTAAPSLLVCLEALLNLKEAELSKLFRSAGLPTAPPSPSE